MSSTLGFDPAKVSADQMVRIFRAAWDERQAYIKMGIFTGPEARQRYDRFVAIQKILEKDFGLTLADVLSTKQEVKKMATVGMKELPRDIT